jgi:general secretion pathway protein G
MVTQMESVVSSPFSVLRCSFPVNGVTPRASSTDNGQLTTDNGSSGFTLLELMIVMVIIGILASIAIPSFTMNVKKAREAVLREDLHTMRSAIDSYTYDKQKAPQTGDDLIQAGYLKVMPVDPFTHRSDTWIWDQGSMLTSVDETDSGIDDVHSGAQEISTEGNTYNTW